MALVSSSKKYGSALEQLLKRPENESFRALIAVGFPVEQYVEPRWNQTTFEKLYEEI